MTTSSLPEPDQTPNVETLLDWLEHHPELSQLLMERHDQPPLPLWRQSLQAVRSRLVASADDFHGTAHVSPATQKDSQLVAGAVTASNWFDGAGNFGLMLIACGAGNPLGWLTAGMITGVLFKFDKDICTTVARGRKGSRGVALVAILVGLLPLSLLKSFGTGLGVEVFQNRPELQQVQAGRILDGIIGDQRLQLQQKEASDPTLLSVQKQCQSGQARLAQLPHGDPRWNSLQVELYGEWSQRRTDWSTTSRSGQRPVCVEQKLQEEAQRSRVGAARRQIEALESQRSLLANDQTFLETTFPDRFAATFESEGQFRSSVELVRVGIDNFFSKLARGHWAAMGLSIYVLSFSLISSAVVCALVIAHSRRPGVVESWSEAVRQRRDRWLADQLAAYDASSPNRRQEEL